jgi:hypothetical protein
VAQSATETLDEAAQSAAPASDLERDRQAWNLPRAPRGAVASEADKDKGRPGAERSRPVRIELPASPKTTE